MPTRLISLLSLALVLSWSALTACPSAPPQESAQEATSESPAETTSPDEANATTEPTADVTEPITDAPTTEPASEPQGADDAGPADEPPQEAPAELAADIDTGGFPRLQAPTISTPVSGPSTVQIQPSLAVGNDGSLAMTYTASETDKLLGIFFVLVDQDGKAKGSHVRLDTFQGGNKTESEVCALATGGYVAAWSADTKNPDPKIGNLEVHFRIIDATGKPVNTESTQVKTDQPGNHWLARITCLKSGGFAVAAVYPDDGQSFGVFVQRYDSQGQAVGDALKLNKTMGGNQAYPVVAAADDGSLAVAWEQDTGKEVVFRLISPDNKTISAEFTPPKSGSGSSRPGIALIPTTGEIILTIQRTGSAPALYTYDKDGSNQQAQNFPDATRTNFASTLLRPISPDGTFAAVYIKGPNNSNGSPTVALLGKHPQPAFAIATGRIPLPYRPAVAYQPSANILWVAYTERTDVTNGLTIKLARFK